MNTKSKIDMTVFQQEQLQALLRIANGGPSLEVAQWFEKTFGEKVTLRCPKCKDVAFAYPMILHLQRKHHMTQEKALRNLFWF